MQIVQAENLVKSYQAGEHQTTAINQANFTIKQGAFVAFVGPSGSGKSTLLNMLGCLDQPSSGKLCINQTDISTLNRRQAAQFRGEHIGFIFQDFNLIPVLTVEENIEYPLLMVQNRPLAERRERVNSLMEAVGFIEYAKNPEDPELSREGFVMAALHYQQGSLNTWQNLSHSLYLLPRNRHINSELNPDSGMTLAAKSSLLITQTDMDFYLRYDSAPNAQNRQAFSISFASNITSNLEIHGDFAYKRHTQNWHWDGTKLSTQTENLWHQVVGLRYLDQRDITWIIEWLHQPKALSSNDLRDFNQQVLDSVTPELQFAKSIFKQPTALQNQLYLRASQKDWLGIVYLNASLSLLINPADKRFTLTPEWIYQPLKNHELYWRYYY